MRRRTRTAALALLLATASIVAIGGAQERGPTPASPQDLQAAVGKLGDIDYATRVKAGRVIRRAPGAAAVPVLLQAAREHADGYIRFKALVLLVGFADPRTLDAMEESLGSPNDRLREVAYGFFEHDPAPRLAPRLLAALDKETGEFVRPSLVRALAAMAPTNPQVRDALIRDAMRGQDYFRSSVIEALGDYKIAPALPRLLEIAKIEGPLQDDAVLALGKLGDKAALGTLAELQRTGSRVLQPSVAAAICTLGQNCSSHLEFIQKTLGFAEDFPGYQDLIRSSAAGLAAIGAGGNGEAVTILLDIGVPSEDPLRAPVALALGQVALRNTPALLKVIEARKDRDQTVSLLAEGFDMLEEDLEEERFFALVRRTYWAAPDKSPTRALCEYLIAKLDF